MTDESVTRVLFPDGAPSAEEVAARLPGLPVQVRAWLSDIADTAAGMSQLEKCAAVGSLHVLNAAMAGTPTSRLLAQLVEVLGAAYVAAEPGVIPITEGA